MGEMKVKKQKVVAVEGYCVETVTELGLGFVEKEFEMYQVENWIDCDVEENKELDLYFDRKKVDLMEEVFLLQGELEREDRKYCVRLKRVVEK